MRYDRITWAAIIIGAVVVCAYKGILLGIILLAVFLGILGVLWVRFIIEIINEEIEERADAKFRAWCQNRYIALGKGYANDNRR